VKKRGGVPVIREYVDIAINSDEDKTRLADLVVKLILQLKLLYFKRKTKAVPTKGKPLRKRYMLGLKEVQKHLNSGNLTMIILATNMEKVEEDRGTDQIVA